MPESSDRHAGVKLENDDVSVKVEVDDEEFLQGTCTVLNLETKWKDDQAELSRLRSLEAAYISARNELVRLQAKEARMDRDAARLAPSQAQKTQHREGPYRLEWLLPVPQKRYADQIEGLDSLHQIQRRPLPVTIRSDTLRATKRPRKVDNEELEQLHGEKTSRLLGKIMSQLLGKIMSQLETKESEDQSIIEKELDEICQDERSLRLLIFGIM
jgi:hypothetical protein